MFKTGFALQRIGNLVYGDLGFVFQPEFVFIRVWDLWLNLDLCFLKALGFVFKTGFVFIRIWDLFLNLDLCFKGLIILFIILFIRIWDLCFNLDLFLKDLGFVFKGSEIHV